MVDSKGIFLTLAAALIVVSVSANPGHLREKRAAVNPVALSCQAFGLTNNPLQSLGTCGTVASEPDEYCQSQCPNGIGKCVDGIYCNCTSTAGPRCYPNNIAGALGSIDSGYTQICNAACLTLAGNKTSNICPYPATGTAVNYICACTEPHGSSPVVPPATNTVVDGLSDILSPIISAILQNPLLQYVSQLLGIVHKLSTPASNLVCTVIGPKLDPLTDSLSVPTCFNYSYVDSLTNITSQITEDSGVTVPTQTTCNTTLPISTTLPTQTCICNTLCPDSASSCDQVGYCTCNKAPSPQLCGPNVPVGGGGVPDTTTLACSTLCSDNTDPYNCYYNYCVCVPKNTPTTTTTTKKPLLGLLG